MILKAVVLGFSSGIFCLGYCYPILGPVMLSRRENTFKSTALSLALFLLGRLSAYIIFGVLVGILGRYLKGIPLLYRLIIPFLYLVLGSLMILYGATQSFPQGRLCRPGSRYFQNQKFLLVVGFLAGINLCPPFLLALSYSLSLGEIGKSVLFFIFFFLATSVFMLPFLFSGLISRFNSVRAAARFTALIAGAWFIYLAAKQFTHW
ncbi:hypothetical protein ES703_109030 [subsurface metagenome]